MKTPMQEMLEYLLEYYNIYGFNEEPFINKEKEFAKQCFEAGQNYQMDDWFMEPNFETFYKHFEQ